MGNGEQQKLGGGIITVSVIHLVFSSITVLILLGCILAKDALNEQLKLMGYGSELSTGQLSISLVLSLVLIFAVIMILNKKALGVYIYFAEVLINLIYSVAVDGFKGATVFGLILPALMAVFIMQKKEMFGIGAKAQNIDM